MLREDKMTRRFSRRILELNDVSAASLKNHPKLNDSDDALSLTDDYDTELDFLDSRRSSVISDIISCSTNCSSVTSLDDDEFDKESADTVKRLFDNIDSMLYENVPSNDMSATLVEECLQWTSRYPHLRVVGKQIVPEGDTGFSAINVDAKKQVIDFPEAEMDGLCLSDLGINGKQMDIYVPMVTSGPENKTSGNVSFQSEHEEVILQDGEYEELIAVDNSDENIFNSLHKKKLSEVDDISPQQINFIADRICDSLTNKIWNEVVSWIRPLLTEFVQYVQEGIPKVSAKTAPPILPSYMASKTPIYSSVRMATAPPRSLVKNEFHDILNVSSKPLQYRQDRYKLSSYSPETTVMKSGRHFPSESSVSPANTKKRMMLRRIPTAIRLTPLDHSVKTPLHNTKNDNWISSANLNRHKSVKPTTARIPSSYWTRHIHLPPINHGDNHCLPAKIEGETSKKNEKLKRDLQFPVVEARNIHDVKKENCRLKSTASKQLKTASIPKSPEHEKNIWAKSSASIHLTQIEENDVGNAGLREQWEIVEEKEFDAFNEEPIHTVEPFVTWLLSQVQSNACKAAKSSKIEKGLSSR